MVEFLLNVWKPLLEIVIIWFVFYMLFLFIRGTRAVQVLKGLLILFIAFFIAQRLQLTTINWVLTKLFAISVVAFLIIFQPELRRGLARIGRGRLSGLFLKEEETIDEIVKACGWLAKRKIGALIAIEREIGLKTYLEGGVPLDSKATSELIQTIFMPNAPLHDGGIIIQEESIAAAGCLFPLTENPSISKTMGTRHRAAIGLTEETDAICVVVSEETGAISMAVGGNLTRDLELQNLKKVLRELYWPRSEQPRSLFEHFRRRKVYTS